MGVFQGRPELPTHTDRPRLRLTASVIAHFISLFAGVPFVNLQYEELEPLTAIDYIVPICAVLASYCAVIYAENALKNNLLNRLETVIPELEQARLNLSLRITSSIDSTRTMSQAEVTRLFKLLTQKNQPGNSNESIYAKLTALFSRSRATLEHIASQTMRHTVKKTIRDLLGYSFGGAATYVLYGLAVQTSNSAYENAYMGAFTGALALSTNAVFNAALGQVRAAQLYNPEASNNFRPTIRGSVLQFLASSAASPSTYLAIIAADSTFTMIMAIVTFVGGGLAKYPGFDYLAEEIVSFVENLFYSDKPEVQRKNLIKMLTKIRAAIPFMHRDQVIAFSEALGIELSPALRPELEISVETPVADEKQSSPSASKVIFHNQAFFPPSPKSKTSAPDQSTSPDIQLVR